MVIEDGIGVEVAINRDESRDALHHRPLKSTGHEDRRVAQKMDARLGRELGQDGKRVEPVQVVSDEDVVAIGRNVLASPNLDAKEGMQDGAGGELEQAEHGRRRALHGQEVGGRRSRRQHSGM